MKKGNILYMVSGGLVGLTLMSVLMLASLGVSANAVVDTVTVAVPESCTISTPSGAGQVYNVSVVNGQYKDDIGKTRLSVFCNTQDSFAIYAIGYSGDTFGSTEMIATNTNGTNIATGTATSGNTSNWAMKLEAVTGTGGAYTPSIVSPFNNFAAVPNSYTKVVEVASATGSTVDAAVDASYAIYISPRHPNGSYVGKVRYTVVHPASEVPQTPQACTAGKICYFPNASGVVDTMGDQTETYDAINDTMVSIVNNASVQLWASNFKRPGYGFAGWNTEYDYSGTTYGPNQIIDTTGLNVETNGLTLYAVWVKSAGNLQNWTGCNSLASGAVTALTDTRDNNTYAVAKLADSNCWMIENMRLGSTTATTLTPTDSNVTANFTLSASTNPTTTAWCEDWNATCTDQSILNSDNTTNSVASMTTPDANIYSYGNYYNWYSATAGSRSYNDGAGNAPSSICPIGWKLPKGYQDDTDYGDFYRMVSAISGKTLDLGNIYYWENIDPDYPAVMSALKSYPNNFVSSGGVWDSSVGGRGATGYFWPSTADDSDYARGLYFGPDNVAFGYHIKRMGNTVRCFAGS